MAGSVNNLSPQQNWQSIGGNGLNGYNNQGGYGGPVARGDLDAMRIGTGRVPQAQPQRIEEPGGYFVSGFDGAIIDSILGSIDKKESVEQSIETVLSQEILERVQY